MVRIARPDKTRRDWTGLNQTRRDLTRQDFSSTLTKGIHMQQTSTRAIGQHHPITVLLIEHLTKSKVGDFESDISMQRLCGLPVGVNQKGYGYLQSAIRYLEKTGIVWKRIPTKEGIKRQEPEEIIERTQNDLRCISRKTRRSSGRLSHGVDVSALPQEKRPIALALAAQLGAMQLIGRTDSTKKLMNATGTPQIGDAMRIFG